MESLDDEYKPNDPGRYFNFDYNAWEATFGGLVDYTAEVDAKVCRSGVSVYEGKIDVFAPEHSVFDGKGVTKYIGRRGPSSNDAHDGDWHVNDVIVSSGASCPSVSCDMRYNDKY